MMPWFREEHGSLPLKYYYESINILKKHYHQMTIFVFSNDLNWVKNNFKFDVPVEFVEGCEKSCEELFLMSYCKHNIIANSITPSTINPKNVVK